MCSIGDDNFEDLDNLKYMPSKEKPSSFSKCNKCREAVPIVVLRSKDKYCRNCFLAGATHKFKATLGKHKLIRPNDRVLVVHKCGHPSTALLHFIRTGLDLETHKKLRFEPVVLFVEEHTHLPPTDRQELVRKVEKEVLQFEFQIYLTSLSKLITTKSVESVLYTNSDYLELCKDDQTAVAEYVDQQLNETNKNDFLNIIKQKLLVKIAKHLSCKFVFTPETSSDVASQLLTDISLGRGSHVSLNASFCDFRDEFVKTLRPLRLFDLKELAFYNHLNSLEPITFRKIDENPYKSVQQLMKKFVNELQVNYPATVTTILKTGDKLTLATKVTNKCDFCNAPIEEEQAELTSVESTQFSHWVSTQTPEERYLVSGRTFNNLNCDNYCFACKKFCK
ncbi:cytoplasmic tRNA 2-thiolation protein 2 [Tribolium madens]|uniref:cytoplasmic tRNA 2-thiolation protein 2 n=1 Tax=Tribolium madens TaxID=41895 RepID=UPI001CF74A2A|nr:cytoplasmic tRNA 2-thiolation protein 2 [Tribolium madens]